MPIVGSLIPVLYHAETAASGLSVLEGKSRDLQAVEGITEVTNEILSKAGER